MRQRAQRKIAPPVPTDPPESDRFGIYPYRVGRAHTSVPRCDAQTLCKTLRPQVMQHHVRVLRHGTTSVIVSPQPNPSRPRAYLQASSLKRRGRAPFASSTEPPRESSSSSISRQPSQATAWFLYRERAGSGSSVGNAHVPKDPLSALRQ